MKNILLEIQLEALAKNFLLITFTGILRLSLLAALAFSIDMYRSKNEVSNKSQLRKILYCVCAGNIAWFILYLLES